MRCAARLTVMEACIGANLKQPVLTVFAVPPAVEQRRFQSTVLPATQGLHDQILEGQDAGVVRHPIGWQKINFLQSDGQGVVVIDHEFLFLGLNQSAKASPIRLNAKTVQRMAMPGARAIQGERSRY